MTPQLEVYQETVQRVFADLKRIAHLEELGKRRIALARPAIGCLVPVCEVHAADEALITILADWRRINTWAYPTQFEVTREGTRNWLRTKVLDAPGRIMFLVESHGNLIGHLGLADGLNPAMEMKVDNVMRGKSEGQPGGMGQALLTMLDWAEKTFAPRRFYLPVFTDNEHAISFYHRAGFMDHHLIALRRHKENGCVHYRPLADMDWTPPDRHHLIMTRTPLRRSWSAVLRNWWADGLHGKKYGRAESNQTAARKAG